MDRAIRALIVDDDTSARSILQKFLELGENVQVVGSESNTASATIALERNEVDVIFLDINMPKEDGLQFVLRLKKLDICPEIVFTTAYRNYAAAAFNLKPIDFLVKPFGVNDVFDVLTKIENHFEELKKRNERKKVWGKGIPEKIKLKTPNGYSIVNHEDIVFVRVLGGNCEVIFKDGRSQKVYSILSEVFYELKDFNFLKLNRSIAINLNYLKKIDKKTRTCIVHGDTQEYEFTITREVFKHFENMKSVKLG